MEAEYTNHLKTVSCIDFRLGLFAGIIFAGPSSREKSQDFEKKGRSGYMAEKQFKPLRGETPFHRSRAVRGQSPGVGDTLVYKRRSRRRNEFQPVAIKG